jgi:hypothetical protein
MLRKLMDVVFDFVLVCIATEAEGQIKIPVQVINLRNDPRKPPPVQDGKGEAEKVLTKGEYQAGSHAARKSGEWMSRLSQTRVRGL